MNKLQIKNIQLFDNILFLHCVYNTLEQRISFNFSFNHNQLLLSYNYTNQFLSFYKFNGFNIENFLLQVINNTLKEKSIIVTEDNIPF